MTTFEQIKTYEQMGFGQLDGSILITELDALAPLSREIIVLYNFLFLSRNERSQEEISRAVLLLAQRVVVYQDFHDMSRQMYDDRMGDYNKTAIEIGGKINKNYPESFDIWYNFIASCKERLIISGLKLRQIPDMPFLSNLTTIHDTPSPLEFDAPDFPRVPSIP